MKRRLQLVFCQKEKEHRVLMLTALVLNLASSHGSRVGKSAHGVLINSHGRSDSLTAAVCGMELLSVSQYQDGAESSPHNRLVDREVGQTSVVRRAREACR